MVGDITTAEIPKRVCAPHMDAWPSLEATDVEKAAYLLMNQNKELMGLNMRVIWSTESSEWMQYFLHGDLDCICLANVGILMKTVARLFLFTFRVKMPPY